MRQIAYGPEAGPDSMRIVEAARPKPGPGQILIEVHFAGVNGPDLMQRQGRYPPPPGASPVLGLEVAGTVAELGPGASEWKVGDWVTALVPGGGYADYCLTSERHALPIPQGLTPAQAAGLPETWFTVWANLIDGAGLKAGERVLIHGGSSGVGLTAISLARLVGAVPLVTVGNGQKAQFCREFGAEVAIDYRQEDFVARIKEVTQKEGVEVVLDMVGGDYLQRDVSVLKRDGRLVLISFQLGSKVEFDFMPVMIKRLTVTGSTMRPRTVDEKARIRDALLREVWPALASGRVRTHVFGIYPFEKASEAHRIMESREHVGKLILQLR
ncbi:MAG TPA: NAD(P)H-quinone oxidoreductase [Burkholderiaceae bacterium]|jgi:putative PIG3 family NAD(P)H quinone oxidoreductase|nr:NAD(P)H-quinone oxidoreductase [Burkholderiaceae bacterium]